MVRSQTNQKGVTNMEAVKEFVTWVLTGYLVISGAYVLIFVLKNKKFPPL